MWSAISKDFGELTQSLRNDSRGFVDLVGKIAADVVGHGGVYAGDEITEEARAMPLETEVLLEFQDRDETYCEPLTADEQQLFPVWAAESPFSSPSVRARVLAREGAESRDAWPGDEPVDESRQRLLDYSEMVLAKYTALVGDNVSPRASPAGSPVRLPATDAAATAEEGEGEGEGEASGGAASPSAAATPSKPPAAEAGGGPVAGQTPSPSKAAAGGLRLSEDDFFDRYFFRLAQLRAYRAERRREEAAAAAAASSKLKVIDEGAVSASPSPASGEEGGDDDDDVQVPAFARKIMAAANELVTNLDAALTGEGGRGAGGDDDDDAGNVPLPRESLDDVTAKVAALEEVVQELQMELRRERHRVRQLTETLEANNIAVPDYLPTPASTQPSPAKESAGATE